MADTGKHSWESSNDAYERGMMSAVAQSKAKEEKYIRAFGDRLMSHIAKGMVVPDEDASTPGTWSRYVRAVEHIVTDINPTAAATPHGVVTLGTSVATPLAQTWMDDASAPRNTPRLSKQRNRASQRCRS